MSMKTEVQQDRSRIVVTGVASAALGAMFTLIGASAFGTSSPGASDASPLLAAQVTPTPASLPTTTYACVVPDVSIEAGTSTSGSNSHKAGTSHTSDSATKNGHDNGDGSGNKDDNANTDDGNTDNGNTDNGNADNSGNTGTTGSSLIDADVAVGIAPSHDQLADVTAGVTVGGDLVQVPLLDVDADAALGASTSSASLLDVTGTVSGLHHILGSPLAKAGLNVDILGDD